MILKELDPFPRTDDPLLCAGRRAEEQMAYYLRRAFADNPDVAVLNGIRIEHRQTDGTPIYAQIDHLLIHRAGFVIVESKSVSGQVRVNERGEWMREWGRGERRGMASPILQANEQATLLRKVLGENAAQLVGKFLGMQVRFSTFEYDVLIAISDNGIIDFPKNVRLPEVGKADQIPQRVRERIDKQKKSASIFTLNPAATMSLSIKQEEVENICRFLRETHKPLIHESLPDKRNMASAIVREATAAPSYRPAPVATAPITQPMFACRHCASERLAMLWGKFGYYFRCDDCSKNTAVEKTILHCDECQSERRIRKDRENFYVECSSCASAGKIGASQLLYTNPRGVAV